MRSALVAYRDSQVAVVLFGNRSFDEDYKDLFCVAGIGNIDKKGTKTIYIDLEDDNTKSIVKDIVVNLCKRYNIRKRDISIVDGN
jgi:hypothetical protein